MIKAILWDMDGVLVDTTDLHYWSWATSLETFGFQLTRTEFISTFGKNNRATLHQLFGSLPDNLVVSIIDRKEILFRQNLDSQVRIYPGVLDWLKFAKEHNIQNAVASSAPPENIDAIVDHFHLSAYFSVCISASSLPSKPDPAVFLSAANSLGILPRSCLVIEDAPVGALAALSANMRCLVVLTTRTLSEFPEVDLVVNNLSEMNPDIALKKISQGVRPSG